MDNTKLDESKNSKIKELEEELDILKKVFNFLDKEISSKKTLYNVLIWSAKNHQLDNFKELAVKDLNEKLTQKFHEEFEKFENSDNQDWVHGFNSGALAMSKMVFDITRAHILAKKLVEDQLIIKGNPNQNINIESLTEFFLEKALREYSMSSSDKDIIDKINNKKFLEMVLTNVK